MAADSKLAFSCSTVPGAVEPPPQQLGQQEASSQHSSRGAGGRDRAACTAQIALPRRCCICMSLRTVLLAVRHVAGCMWSVSGRLAVQGEQRRQIVRRDVLVAAVCDEAHDGSDRALYRCAD